MESNCEVKRKPKTWLLTDVPEDIEQMIKDHQATKKRECGCRYGRAQAIFHLLRKAKGKEIQ